MRAIPGRRWQREGVASGPEDHGWTALRMESRRRFHVGRAWLRSVLPAALATARSGAPGDAAILVALSLYGLGRPRRRSRRAA